jgi:hypothetical protein
VRATIAAFPSFSSMGAWRLSGAIEMVKPSISIGVDDATGQPASAPAGPYITDEDDGSRPRKRASARQRRRGNRVQAEEPNQHPAEADLGSRRRGPTQP